MNMNYIFVSRHKGAREWAAKHVQNVHIVSHLSLDDIHKGDKVYGILPIDLVEKICTKGARYFALVIDRKKSDRGKELTARQLKNRNARFVEYRVRKVSSV